MNMKPSALIYGESTCVIKPLSCFLVSFNVNSLYRRQNAVDTIPPAPTPRTYQGKEKKEIIIAIISIKKTIHYSCE